MCVNKFQRGGFKICQSSFDNLKRRVAKLLMPQITKGNSRIYKYTGHYYRNEYDFQIDLAY